MTRLYFNRFASEDVDQSPDRFQVMLFSEDLSQATCITDKEHRLLLLKQEFFGIELYDLKSMLITKDNLKVITSLESHANGPVLIRGNAGYYFKATGSRGHAYFTDTQADAISKAFLAVGIVPGYEDIRSA